MALPPTYFNVNLNEKIVDGASLVHKTVEQHTCGQLRRWLKCHNRKQGGKKTELVERVKNALRSNAPINPGLDKGKWFRMEIEKQQRVTDLGTADEIHNFPTSWTPFPSVEIPSNFSFSGIYDYIISSCISNAQYDLSEDELEQGSVHSENHVIDYSSSKPLERGKLYVESNHVINMFDAVTKYEQYCVKSQVKASYTKGTLYDVCIKINPDGKVVVGRCNCKASALGRCAHVAALLYQLLQYRDSISNENVACTSQLCSWNRGAKKKEPKVVHERQYQNKTSFGTKRFFDPGNSFQNVHSNVIEDVLQNLQVVSSNPKNEKLAVSAWELLLVPRYEEYDLTLKRKSILRKQVYQFTAALNRDQKSPMDLTAGMQKENSDWLRLRKLLITASNIKSFENDKSGEQIYNLLESQLWSNKEVFTLAMKYGCENEKIAREQYSMINTFRVTETGLWINPKFPGIGASPDALVTDISLDSSYSLGVMEVKCPKILENFMPNELHKLTPQQKSSFCCKIIDEKLTLKKTHKYYYQVQVQMAITERLWCDFVIWTPKGFNIERVWYDANFVEPLLKRVSAFHQNILAPEYFEMRIPRQQNPFDLSKQ